MMNRQEELKSRLRSIELGKDEFGWNCPVIGISGNFRNGDCTLAKAYYESVLEAGATPVIIPPFDRECAIAPLLDTLDGIIFSGGADIDPVFLEEQALDCIDVNSERDMPELLLLSMALDRHIPVLGICRGMQLIAVGLGGRMYQDIRQQHGAQSLEHSQHTEFRHETSHSVTFAEGSRLGNLFGRKSMDVNSFHHQAVSEVPVGFAVSAQSPDGIIEAMEASDERPVMAVQWHPESFIMNGDRCMMPVFEWLVREASLMKRARRLHNTTLILDSHEDCPMFFDKGSHFYQKNPGVEVEWAYVGDPSPDGNPTFRYNPLVDLHKMKYGMLDAAFMVAYLHQDARDAQSLKTATAKADRLLDLIDERIGECFPYAAIALTPQQLWENKLKGVKSIVKGIENGYAIGLDVTNVERFRKRGVAYMTLCHNGDNDLCGSARGEGEHGGLTRLGRETVKEMNRVGMMVDLSHASVRSLHDAIETSSKPVICSHTSSRALCNHPRNLDDDDLRLLASSGGVSQVCIYSGFLRENGEAGVRDAVNHILHMLDVMGCEHVGIGTDMDGGGGVPGLDDASWLNSLTRRLMSEGLDDYTLARLWGLNFLEVWKRNLVS
ncbi:MAG: membrane dipeptidase [Bacteroidaceae bacterium]|nr:membrane dipeptidase [Bacteroidaceae bacterium]